MRRHSPRWHTAPMRALRLRRERLEWRRVDGEVIAVDLEASTYLSANESAAPLWEALAEGTTRDDLIARLVGAAGIDRDRRPRGTSTTSSASWPTVGSLLDVHDRLTS